MKKSSLHDDPLGKPSAPISFLRPSFYPPLPFHLSVEQGAEWDLQCTLCTASVSCDRFLLRLILPLLALISRTVMGGRCPFQRALQWGNNKFEEWGTRSQPFRFICHLRYVEVDLEQRVPGIFPGHRLWYRRHANTQLGSNFLTIGRKLGRSCQEVVYVAAAHQKLPASEKITAEYGIVRVSRALDLEAWDGIIAEDPLVPDFDGNVSRWEISPEAGPELVLCAQIPPYIYHITSYIADLIRPYRDDI